jgi:putative hydrolase of the HAD superfamily
MSLRKSVSGEDLPERAHGTIPSASKFICQKLGVPVTKAQVETAAGLRLEYTRACLLPRADAVPVLQKVRSLGYRTALVSDCSPEVPALWDCTPFFKLFDAALFSCSVKLKKPDPRIYNLAAERLGVRPEDCLYIGDGSSRELDGAAVGMTPVLSAPASH